MKVSCISHDVSILTRTHTHTQTFPPSAIASWLTPTIQLEMPCTPYKLDSSKLTLTLTLTLTLKLTLTLTLTLTHPSRPPSQTGQTVEGGKIE